MMNNFDYMTPTRLIFGKDVVNQLPEVMSAIGKRVLLAYGGGSIKRMGLYDKVKELMKNEAAADLLEKYAPGFKTNPQMKLVGALTFRKLASFPHAGLDAAKVEEIDAALKALGE